MATNLPPPTGDAKNPPTSLIGWGKLFGWLYLLWQWVTVTLPASLTFGGDPYTYSAAVEASAGQSDIGALSLVLPNVGEVISASNTASPGNGTFVDLLSITLTPGDWIVFGTIFFSPTVSVTAFLGWTNTTSATKPADGLYYQLNATVGAGTAICPVRRYTITTNTTVYLSLFVNYPSGSVAVAGNILALRIR